MGGKSLAAIAARAVADRPELLEAGVRFTG
jgi:hypothetical protein